MNTPWHADSEVLRCYATGRLGAVEAASVEAHLTACPSCRAELRPAVDRDRLDAIFAGISYCLDSPGRGRIERFLRMLRVRPDTARLLAATPLMGASWIGSVVLVLGFGVAAAVTDSNASVFLVIAPLAPVAGVAVAFSRTAEPALQVVKAAPYSLFRLLMIRSLAVIITTGVGALVVSPFVQGAPVSVAAWLLPALALTSLTIAASGHLDSRIAAAGVVGGWVVAVLVARADTGVVALFRAPSQAACAGLVVVALLVAWRGRDRFGLASRSR